MRQPLLFLCWAVVLGFSAVALVGFAAREGIAAAAVVVAFAAAIAGIVALTKC